MRICILTTTDLIVRFFLIDILRALTTDHQVTLIVNTDDPSFLTEYGIDARVISLPIKRDIAPFSDVVMFWKLLRIYHNERFDAVHSIAPKAGLLGMLAATLSRVPVRIHTFQGEVWASRKSILRLLLKIIDWLVSRMSTTQLVVSRSEREFLIDQGILRHETSQVLANGSICGVDSKRFYPDPSRRRKIREELKIPKDAIVFIYVGRISRDKGVLDLAAAFSMVAEKIPHVWLLVTGPDEQGLIPEMETRTKGVVARTRFLPVYTSVPENYMAASDVLCLPSYREGFGLVIIEAAATGLPAIASRIYGITDALEHESTGLLFTVGNVVEMAGQMRRLAENSELRTTLGARARVRALQLFEQQEVVTATMKFYAGLAPHAE